MSLDWLSSIGSAAVSIEAATWVEAVGTLTATGVALYLLYRAQLDRDRRNELEERSQANQVHITKVRTVGVEGIEGSHMDWTFTCDVDNKSPDPISEAKVWFHVTLAGVSPGDFVYQSEEDIAVGRVDGESLHTVTSGVVRVPWDVSRGGTAEPRPISLLDFVDASKRHWLRDGSGALQQYQELAVEPRHPRLRRLVFWRRR